MRLLLSSHIFVEHLGGLVRMSAVTFILLTGAFTLPAFDVLFVLTILVNNQLINNKLKSCVTLVKIVMELHNIGTHCYGVA